MITTPSYQYNWENKTILIAEDIDFNYLFLASALKYTRANTLWAKDGQMAVEMCRNHKVDLVLMDIQMPSLNGLEAARVIKKEFPHLPIIAQTAFAMQSDIDRYISEGFNDYLTKPIQIENLNNILAKYLQ